MQWDKFAIKWIIKIDKLMIEMAENLIKHDRLAAFLKTFGLRTTVSREASSDPSANLFVIDDDEQHPAQVVFRVSGGQPSRIGGTIVAAARVDFGGLANPLVGALPEELVFPFDRQPQMRNLAELLVAEVQDNKCGGQTVQNRLCEIMVVYAVRQAIALGTVNAGLLAGLTHPQLTPCLVAMHDDPAHNWQTASLARLAGMSRSAFVTLFKKTVGMTPVTYLTTWRLAFGRAEIAAGHSVKAAAGHAGFGSSAAFSRAFTRQYGYPPATLKAVGTSQD